MVTPSMVCRIALPALMLLAPVSARAQGCMPIRFVTPLLAWHGDVYLRRHAWQVGLAYRRLVSDEFVVGHDVRNDLGPGKEASIVHSHSATLSMAYAVSRRLSLELNIPYATANTSRIFGDGIRHETSAGGLGEVNLFAQYWLRETALSPGGNLAVGLGVKAPTGSHTVEDDFWNKTGPPVRFPVDQSIQPGDGGWGIILQAQGFQPIVSRGYVYAAGSYTANPRKTTEVVRNPGSTEKWGVPDTWNARAGVAMVLLPAQGLSLSLGGRLDGTTKRDLIGGGAHVGFRRPAIVGYVDPGVSLTHGGRTLAVNVPVRAWMDFRKSYIDVQAGRVGGGGLARYLIQASFTQRFQISGDRTPPRGP